MGDADGWAQGPQLLGLFACRSEVGSCSKIWLSMGPEGREHEVEEVPPPIAAAAGDISLPKGSHFSVAYMGRTLLGRRVVHDEVVAVGSRDTGNVVVLTVPGAADFSNSTGNNHYETTDSYAFSMRGLSNGQFGVDLAEKAIMGQIGTGLGAALEFAGAVRKDGQGLGWQGSEATSEVLLLAGAPAWVDSQGTRSGAVVCIFLRASMGVDLL